MDEENVIATGLWCLICQFIEDDDVIENDRCVSCGCEDGAHQHVKVVAT